MNNDFDLIAYVSAHAWPIIAGTLIGVGMLVAWRIHREQRRQTDHLRAIVELLKIRRDKGGF